MNQTAVIKQEHANSVYVLSCKPVNHSFFCAELDSVISVWGIQAFFSDGQTVTVPDLCTNRDLIEILAKRLSGASLSPDFLEYIIDDFLAEIYG
jgi:hypothetical protein